VKKPSGPGIEYPSSGVALAYTPLQLVSMSDDDRWVAVAILTSITPDGIGWVNAAYLQQFAPNTLR
jgi:hypothetical protein